MPVQAPHRRAQGSMQSGRPAAEQGSTAILALPLADSRMLGLMG